MRNVLKKLTIVLAAMTVAVPALALEDAVFTGRSGETAIRGYDAVAYFTESKAVKGSKEFVFTWRGGNWRFASQANLDLFAADPARYAPQYGGWCAYAMSDRGRTVRIDPEAWHIHEGKLYLNFSKRVQKVWLEDRGLNIDQADGFYPQTTDVNAWLEKEAAAPAS